MTLGIGGSTPETELERLQDMTQGVASIEKQEFQSRIDRLQALMQSHQVDVTYLNAGSNLYYFTGLSWYPSERMAGVIVPQNGAIEYVAPAFEKGTFEDYMVIEGNIHCWEEHESPYQLFNDVLKKMGIGSGTLGIDEATQYFIFDGIQQATSGIQFTNASVLTKQCRMYKSETEITLLQQANDMTMEVHKSAARILKPGIVTTDVYSFINEAHKAVGASGGSTFCIVLFGEATAYPHGVKNPQVLAENDMVLIDTGCQLQGYNSDITRTYVYGTPSDRQRQVWNCEKAAQTAAFEAAQLGKPCSGVDKAARQVVETAGFGPGYKIPGLPHRTGHGTGLDIHEFPYIVSSDDTPLGQGMSFSNEPMICVPGEFGVRHEDHIYMGEAGPHWYSEPMLSIDDPFAYEA